MAIASLSKFTVPLASDQSASSQGMLMPKLKYRFRIMFENFGVSTPTTELTKQVSEAARPNVSFDDQTIMVYNSTIHYAGRPKWNTFSVKLRTLRPCSSVKRVVSTSVSKSNRILLLVPLTSKPETRAEFKTGCTTSTEVIEVTIGLNVG